MSLHNLIVHPGRPYRLHPGEIKCSYRALFLVDGCELDLYGADGRACIGLTMALSFLVSYDRARRTAIHDRARRTVANIEKSIRRPQGEGGGPLIYNVKVKQ